MPKKPNHAGQMQNYVPKGNGDASGEYGDDVTGSNVHYKSKGEEGTGIGIVSKPPKKKEEDDPFMKGFKKGLGEEDKGTFGAFDENTARDKQFKMLSDAFIGEEEEKFKQAYEKGSLNSKKALDRYSTTERYKKTVGSSACDWGAYYSLLDNKLASTRDNSYIKFNEYAKERTFWHENGHSIDFLGRFSEQYKTSNGKTVAQALDEDTFQNSPKGRRELFAKIQSDYQADLKKETGYSEDEVDQLSSGISKDVYAKAKERYEQSGKTRPFYDVWREYEMDIMATPEITKRLDEVAKIRKKQNEVSAKWCDVSDVCSGMSRNRMKMNGEHPARYWNDYKGNRAHEFFAEAFSSKSIDYGSYELLKKYFPNAMGAFEEIYDKLTKGEIKQ